MTQDEVRDKLLNKTNAVQPRQHGASGAEAAVEVWNGLKDFFVGIWNAITGAAQSIWNGLKSFFSGLWEGIKNIFQTVLSAIKDAKLFLIKLQQDGRRYSTIKTVRGVLLSRWRLTMTCC